MTAGKIDRTEMCRQLNAWSEGSKSRVRFGIPRRNDRGNGLVIFIEDPNVHPSSSIRFTQEFEGNFLQMLSRIFGIKKPHFSKNGCFFWWYEDELG